MISLENSGQDVESAFVVGIGASAGGLRALNDFFKTMPPNNGCCVVVVQHLAPDFKSTMEQLLARQTALPVLGIENGTRLRANTVLLAPPRTLVEVCGGELRVAPAEPGQLPIDHFFRSLSRTGSRCAAVVLSGGGSDGAEGVQAVAEAGGLVLVQQPESAEFDSMPRRALSGVPVAEILPPEAMPDRLLQAVTKEAQELDKRAGPSVDEPSADILDLLQRRYRIDFRQYRTGTIARRLQRRMLARNASDSGGYVQVLMDQPDELEALYHDLLIGVTEFFRDPAVFEYFADHVATPLLREKDGQDIRIWVAGCATGEEAYSLAILFAEKARQLGVRHRLSLFATDLHPGLLDVASEGLYSEGRLSLMSLERRDTYFEPTESGDFRIRPEIRKSVVFARHDLLNDPPFARLDLVTCRNLLIYFREAAQERVLRQFSFALREGGTLVLGTSEAPGQMQETFTPLQKDLKIYRKLPGRTPREPGNSPPPRLLFQPMTRTGPLHQSVSRVLLQAYDAIFDRHLGDGVLVSETLEILHLFGGASRYLLPLRGRTSQSLLARCDGDLKLALSIMIPRAIKQGSLVETLGVRVKADENQAVLIDLTAEPLGDGQTNSSVWVRFLPVRQPRTHGLTGDPPPGDGDFVAHDALRCRIADLELELQGLRDNLRIAVEELSLRNEDLQSANEEQFAANEELQSANEELRSLNEELSTVNAEFERKNDELELLNDDLTNLLQSTQVGILFLDDDLRVRKFNPAIEETFHLRRPDIGRPFQHITYRLPGGDALESKLEEVLRTGEVAEREVSQGKGRWLLERLLPFRNSEGAIKGVVLTFTDISKIKAMEEKLNLALEATRLSWWQWSPESDEMTIYADVGRLLGYHPQTLPRLASEWLALIHPEDREVLTTQLRQAFDGNELKVMVDLRLKKANSGWLWFRLAAQPEDPSLNPREQRWLGTALDITESREAAQEVLRQASILSHIQDAIVCTDLEGSITYWNEGATALRGWTAEEMLGRPAWMRFGDQPGERAEQSRALVRRALDGEVARAEFLDRTKDGRDIWIDAKLAPLCDQNESVVGIVAISRDFTESRRLLQERQEMELQLFQAQKMEVLGTLAGGIAHDFNNLLASILGNAETALEVDSAQLRKEALEDVLRAGERAKDLVRRLLTFSRHDEPERSPVNMVEIVAEIYRFVRATLPSTVEMRISLPETTVAVLADTTQIHQAVLNLCSNATDAMNGRGVLTLALDREVIEHARPVNTGVLPAGTYAVIRVGDSGEGIPSAHLTRLFDPFFTTKTPGKGTGLGLSIVHGIVKGHQGGIEVLSPEGEGTVFHLYLPLSSEPVEPAAPPPETKPNREGRKALVLVVDDEESVARMTQRSLLSLGYQADYVLDAEAALARCAQQDGPDPVDMVLTDLTMPRMTGLELLRHLRAAGNDVPVVICTGHLLVDIPSDLGPVEVILKPYTRATLAESLSSLLSPR